MREIILPILFILLIWWLFGAFQEEKETDDGIKQKTPIENIQEHGLKSVFEKLWNGTNTNKTN